MQFEIGICPYCGGEIIETQARYECMYNNGENHAVIWKSALRKLGGMDLDKRDAQALLNGQQIRVQLKSKKTGKFYYAFAYYDFENNGVLIKYK